MNALLGLVPVAVLCAGCTARVVNVRHITSYRLALDRGEARQCYQACAPYRHQKAEVYARCLARCPDTTVSKRLVCGARDAPPIAECVDVVTYERQRRTMPLPSAVAGALGFIGGFATGAVLILGEQNRAPP